MRGLSLIIGVICFTLAGFFYGLKTKQTQIENRAKKIEKECYTNQDIELIIFNKSQL